MINKDANIAILGYGVEGQALVDYLLKHDYKKLTVCDERGELEVPPGVKTQLADKAFEWLVDYDVIFRSPGISVLRPELQSVRERLNSVTRFFFEHCPCPIIGVSGTKGKGTTSSLTYEILKAAGRDVYLGGNIGDPPVIFLDKLSPDSLVVLELSSFQLQDLDRSPHISIVLNITRDHLDVHEDVNEYREAKESLLRFQSAEDHAIINGDYPVPRTFADLGGAEKHWYSRVDKVEGAFIADEQIFVLGQAVASTKDIALRGQHNLENVLPACLAAKLLGVDDEVIQGALNDFKGLEHRLEFVCEKNGIQYFNDSFSTVPETSIAAIRSFDEPIFLIAGGSEKHSDFTEWAHLCADTPNLKMVLLMGDTADHMESVLQDAVDDHPRDSLLDVVRVKDLESAFAFLNAQTQAGDVVLLSPACASFGLFKNYKERGKMFKELAQHA